MNTSIKNLAVLAALALAPAVAQASVTINLTAGYLGTHTGAPLPFNSTVVVLVDKQGDGITPVSDPVNNWVEGDDLVLERFGTNDFADVGTTQQVLQFLLSPVLASGTKLYMLWYETPYDVNAKGPGENVWYNFFRTDDVVDGSTTGWFIPNDGWLVSFNFLTESAGGVNPDSAGWTTLRTAGPIPEPASLALLGAGAVLMLARRRNRA